MIIIAALSLTAGIILGWMATITTQWFIDRAEARAAYIAALDKVADQMLLEIDALEAHVDAAIIRHRAQ